jgi:hypothetical protein
MLQLGFGRSKATFFADADFIPSRSFFDGGRLLATLPRRVSHQL